MKRIALASYPKSGNTWMRMLLAGYFFGPVQETNDIRRIPDVHVAGELEAARPHNGLLMVKTHFAFPCPRPEASTLHGFVYVIRRPKDVLLSNLHYRKVTAVSSAVRASIKPAEYVAEWIRVGGETRWVAMGFGTWASHAKSWLENGAHLPHVLVRYEDLRADPKREMARVLEMLGEPVDADRLHAAVEGAQFDRMRALEIRSKASQKMDPVFGPASAARHGEFFMNRGRSGQSLREIDPRLDAAIDERFAEPMRQLGYASS
ncbi:MAG: sulfotransferase domain-containing protein [Planctomycetota bacterium]|nr:sulfotransferase domain-containing protein [Planctomycetota bacterium]